MGHLFQFFDFQIWQNSKVNSRHRSDCDILFISPVECVNCSKIKEVVQ